MYNSINVLSDNKSFAELPVGLLLLAMEIPVPESLLKSSSFEQENNKPKQIESSAILFFIIIFFLFNPLGEIIWSKLN